MAKRLKLVKRRKMKPGRGKHKGGAFERAVCKALSLWVSDREFQDLFWRSAMSGGRATVAHKKGLRLPRHSGDITATGQQGHKLTDIFFIECKAYKRLDIDKFVVSGRGVLAGFWRKAVKEAAKFKKQPMLIARQNNFPTICIISSAGRKVLPISDGLPDMAATLGSAVAHVMLFDDLIGSTFDPEWE